MLPHDPAILVSFLNMKLRDVYPSLDALCDDLQEDRDAILAETEKAGWHYDAEANAFVSA